MIRSTKHYDVIHRKYVRNVNTAVTEKRHPEKTLHPAGGERFENT